MVSARVALPACFTASHLSFHSALARRARSIIQRCTDETAFTASGDIVLDFRESPFVGEHDTLVQIRHLVSRNAAAASI